MKKPMVVIILHLVIFAVLPVVLAQGSSEIGVLYLYQNDPTTWTVVEGGAWGKMKYNFSGPTFDFVFNGHGLTPGEDYSLIYYPDPYYERDVLVGNGLICLGSNIANEAGDVHIAGVLDGTSLPPSSAPPGSKAPTKGAQIWLVSSNDVCKWVWIGWEKNKNRVDTPLIILSDSCEGVGPTRMVDWYPEEYLFGDNLITFTHEE